MIPPPMKAGSKVMKMKEKKLRKLLKYSTIMKSGKLSRIASLVFLAESMNPSPITAIMMKE